MIAGIVLLVGLALTGAFAKGWRMVNGDFSDFNIPTTASAFGTMFVFFAPIFWRLANLL